MDQVKFLLMMSDNNSSIAATVSNKSTVVDDNDNAKTKPKQSCSCDWPTCEDCHTILLENGREDLGGFKETKCYPKSKKNQEFRCLIELHLNTPDDKKSNTSHFVRNYHWNEMQLECLKTK